MSLALMCVFVCVRAPVYSITVSAYASALACPSGWARVPVLMLADTHNSRARPHTYAQTPLHTPAVAGHSREAAGGLHGQVHSAPGQARRYVKAYGNAVVGWAWVGGSNVYLCLYLRSCKERQHGLIASVMCVRARVGLCVLCRCVCAHVCVCVSICMCVACACESVCPFIMTCTLAHLHLHPQL